jgi:putative hydrolase of the HAD superfamily
VSTKEPLLDIILFDIDDTLYSTTAFSLSARSNAIQAMIEVGLEIELEQGVLELAEVVVEFSSNYGRHFLRLLDRLGPEASAGRNPAVLIAAGVVAYHRTKESDLWILPDVHQALDRLHHMGVRLGVISAGLHVKQAEKLIRLDALRFFDPGAIFFTDQMGVSKPNPKLYDHTCAQLGVDPTRAMYVGDRRAHDSTPAGSIGMATVHYTGAHGKYEGEAGETEPHHTLSDLRDLIDILRDDYGLDV